MLYATATLDSVRVVAVAVIAITMVVPFMVPRAWVGGGILLKGSGGKAAPGNGGGGEDWMGSRVGE